jgi:hypothetical protein
MTLFEYLALLSDTAATIARLKETHARDANASSWVLKVDNDSTCEDAAHALGEVFQSFGVPCLVPGLL